MDAGATNGATVRLLGYRLLMRSQLSPARVSASKPPGRNGLAATGPRPPAPGRGPTVVAATRPDPTPPRRVKDAPRPCGAAAARPAGRKHPATAAIW
jgi:hypothetical protein